MVVLPFQSVPTKRNVINSIYELFQEGCPIYEKVFSGDQTRDALSDTGN